MRLEKTWGHSPSSCQMKTPGVYRFAVRDLHGRFGPSFQYRLELENESPLVVGSLAVDIIQGKPEKPTEIEVTLERTHGSTDEGTVRLLGLGPEYTCEPVVSKVKEESEKKVTLKVVAVPKADGTPTAAWAGPSIRSVSLIDLAIASRGIGLAS